jgi:hypothetical protein
MLDFVVILKSFLYCFDMLLFGDEFDPFNIFFVRVSLQEALGHDGGTRIEFALPPEATTCARIIV